jgi:RNA polymerase sigma-B factor
MTPAFLQPALLESRLTRLNRTERAAITDDLVDQLRCCDSPERADTLRAQLILANRGVAEAIATRYRGRGITYDDLVQAAYEGLTKAVQRFDPGLESDLLSYAVPLMRGEIQRYFRDHGWAVRPPRKLQELQWQIGQVVDQLESDLGREPSETEVQAALDIAPEEYRDALAAFGSFRPTSLDQPTNVSSSTALGDLLPAGDEERSRCEARVVVTRALQSLSQRDRRMLYLRFYEDLTQQEIGDDLGMSQMQVSRTLQRLLHRLRSIVGDLDGGTAPDAA